MARRKTTEDEERRLTERMRNNHRRNISDRDSFNLAFSEEIEKSDNEMTDKQKALRSRIYKNYIDLSSVQREIKRGHFVDASVFKKAHGKDLKRDRETTAKKVVKTRRAYEKAGADKVDLKGYDTEDLRFSIPARSKRKVVYAYKTHVVVKGKSVIRYRDRKGHFVSVKKK